MSWIYLIAGSFMEIGWATGVSLIDGDVRRGWWSLWQRC